MEEQLISFETAKLAKEEGLVDKEFSMNYYLPDGTMDLEVLLKNPDIKHKGYGYYAPTQSLLQKWLRETHDFEVYVIPQFKKGKCGYDSFKQIGYGYHVLTSLKGSDKCRYLGYPSFEMFPEDMIDEGETLETLKEDIGYTIYSSYEQALEKGLQEALKLNKWKNKTKSN